jgi:hypothetical protein
LKAEFSEFHFQYLNKKNYVKKMLTFILFWILIDSIKSKLLNNIKKRFCFVRIFQVFLFNFSVLVLKTNYCIDIQIFWWLKLFENKFLFLSDILHIIFIGLNIKILWKVLIFDLYNNAAPHIMWLDHLCSECLAVSEPSISSYDVLRC